MNLVLVTKVLESKALEMRYALFKACLGYLEEQNSRETNKSKSKFTPRPQDIRILARFYNKYAANCKNILPTQAGNPCTAVLLKK